jgi:hypothetical protein
MSACNMHEQAATCPAATCSNRRQHVRLQHARTGGNMSGCKMLEQAATSCAFCYNYSHFYGLLDAILVARAAKLKILSAIANSASK